MTDETPAGAPRRPRPAPKMAHARRLYETTDLAQIEIARRLGLKPSSVSRGAKRGCWRRPGPDPRRARVVAELKAGVDRQIAAVEAVLLAARAPEGGSPPEGACGAAALDAAERAGRTLGGLVRTLRELQKYDDEQARAAGEAVEDERPADLDALRDALADRLARLRRAGD